MPTAIPITFVAEGGRLVRALVPRSAIRRPSARGASAQLVPAAIETTLLVDAAADRTGNPRETNVPSPFRAKSTDPWLASATIAGIARNELVLNPKESTEPFCRNTRVFKGPAPTATASLRLVVILHWPLLLSPQASTEPSPLSATLWNAPAAIATMLV